MSIVKLAKVLQRVEDKLEKKAWLEQFNLGFSYNKPLQKLIERQIRREARLEALNELGIPLKDPRAAQARKRGT